MEYLEERGYTLVERNHRTRHGEIDLVMRDEETLAFIPIYKAGLYTKQGPKTPELRFRALLADGAREVCFERVATSYTERDPYPQDHRSPHSAALVAVSVLLGATGDHYWRAVGRQPVTTALL